MLQTTSPSYLLMGSLDINQQILRMDGYNLVKSWAADVEYFYREAARIRGLNLIRRPELDNTKINLTMSALEGAYAVLGCVLVVFSFAVASAIRLSGTYGIDRDRKSVV